MKTRGWFGKERRLASPGDEKMSNRPRTQVALATVTAANAKMVFRHVTDGNVVVVGHRVIQVSSPSRRDLEAAGATAMRQLREKSAA
jgi:hypothetical protein